MSEVPKNNDIKKAPKAVRLAEDAPEAWLVAIAEQRDVLAFARLFRTFAPRLKHDLRRFGATDGVADEVTQEALLMVWRKAHLFDPARAKAGPWMRRIARNLFIDALRREREPLWRLAERPSAPETPEELFDVLEEMERMHIAIEGLGREDAMLVRLAFFEDRSHTDIARRLGAPLGTIKSRVRRALKALRVRFQRD